MQGAGACRTTCSANLATAIMRTSREHATMLQTYQGGCHCGAVRIRVEADLTQISECNCSICTKKGILHLVTPLDRFTLLQGEDAISTYTFGTGVAKHTF